MAQRHRVKAPVLPSGLDLAGCRYLYRAYESAFRVDDLLSPAAPRVVHQSGASHVLRAVAGLETLGRRSERCELLARTRFLLEAPYFGSKVPHIIVHHGLDGEPESAVLLLEYRVRRWGTGIFVPIDSDGDLTVIAPPAARAQASACVANYLFSTGARLLLLSVPGSVSVTQPASPGELPVVVRTRELRRTLPLKPSLDETFAQMGARSRRNLRHAARMVVKQFAAAFVANATISQPDLVAFNRLCSYPVPDWVAELRHRSTCTLPGSFLSGLRTADGRWLSLIGGRRHAEATIVDWQMNRADLGSMSTGTAMRYFQIQCEIERGATSLQFTGGTPHSIQAAFLHEQVTDLLWVRPPYRHRALRRLAARLLPASNRLKTLLADQS